MPTPLSIEFTPGYVFTEGEVVTVSKLNQAANPTISLIGTLTSTTIGTPGVNTSNLYDSAVTTDKINNAAVTADKLAASVAGDGLSGGAGSPLDVNVDGTTIEIVGDTLQVVGGYSAQTSAPSGSARNLVVQSTGNATLTVAAAELILKTAANLPLTVYGVSLTVDIGSGVALNGLEYGGTEAADHWYHIWVISNGTDVRGVLEDAGATGGSAPSAPDLSGAPFSTATAYTYMAYVGSVRNDGSSNFVTFYQTDRNVWLNDTSLVASLTGTGSYAAIGGATLTAMQGLIPAHARTVSGWFGVDNLGGFNAYIFLAANASGLGAAHLTNEVTTTHSIYAPYSIPVVTAQTIYHKADNTSAGSKSIFDINVSGYTI